MIASQAQHVVGEAIQPQRNGATNFNLQISNPPVGVDAGGLRKGAVPQPPAEGNSQGGAVIVAQPPHVGVG